MSKATSKPVVVITDSNFGDDAIEREVLGDQATLETAAAVEPAEVIAAGDGAAGLLVQFAQIDASVFEALGSLRVVVRYGIGLDTIDLDAAAAHGVTVRNVDDYCLDEVADHTAAAVAAASRRLTAFDRQVKAGGWSPHLAAAPLPPSEDPVGVAGFGRIGSAVASRLGAAGHPVLVWDPLAEGRVATAGLESVSSLAELAERVNHLCLHVPATAETVGLVDAALLERLGPCGHLVNSARGALVDEQALLAWLDAAPDAFASLDVLVAEPPHGTGAALAAHSQVLVTPHVAYLSAVSLPRLRRTAARYVLEGLS
jgi:D-3-phosphoglycerate dehydrogenase